jgi:hypothetical protein
VNNGATRTNQSGKTLPNPTKDINAIH